jgi:hypothetical protein
MGEVKRVVSNLMQMLDGAQKEAESLAGIMDELQSYLEEESKTIIEESLDRLLSMIKMEAAKRTIGSVVVVVSPEGRVSVGETYGDEESDPWLRRLKSQGFRIMRLDGFSSLIQSLKSEVAEGNLIPVIEFLRANTKLEWTPVYLPSPAVRKAEQPSEPSTSSEWKLPGWLPAFPWEGPPLPRGLFKD